MPKFSTLAATAASAAAAEVEAQAALAKAEHDRATTRAFVTAAIINQKVITAALPNPDGTVSLYTLTADGTDYAVSVVAGDFDTEDAPAAEVPPGLAAPAEDFAEAA